MTKNPLPTEKITTDQKQISAALRVASVTMGAAAIQVAVYLYYAFTLQAWQMVLLTGIVVVYSIANIISLRLIHKGRIEAGAWPIIIGIILVIVSIALLIEGGTVVFAVILFVLTLLIGSQTLSAKTIRPLFFTSLLLGLLTASLDLFKLDYRLFVPAMQTIVAGITFAMLLAIFFFVIPQATAQLKSLQLKIAIWTGSVITGVLIILVIYTTITGRQRSIITAQNEALAIAVSEARQVRADAEIPLDMARAVAQALTSLKYPDNNEPLSRSQVNAMLRQVLIENPTFLGTYTLWEPNAFDGLDANYVNAEAHDASGRFIPYWVRGDDGSVAVSALIDYETPGIGDWYLLPRQTRTEVTVAPLIYPINGVDTVMASFVVPITYSNKFYGIAGVDAPISFVQDIVDKIDLYNGKADAVLMTSGGTLIGVRNKPELVNQPATEVLPDFLDLQARVEAGESFISPSTDGEFLRIFAPVDLGETGKHWSFVLIIPVSEINAPATTAAIQQGVVGIVLIFFALLILWFLSGQIVRPVRDLTTVATAVSQGNLNIKAEIQSMDETGMLATAFNLMITQLRESFSTLEQRVAERTRGLELAAEVGRTVSQVRALDVMLKDAAEIIRTQFDLYYVQVYLANPSQTTLLLKAGTGSVGAQLLARAHQLPMNTASLNGRAAVEKHPVVIADTTASTTFRPNPLLPDTRSEMAVPLLIGEKVVGVLDLQDRGAGKLNQESLGAFEALAGQLAIAIQNANFLAETEQARAEIEAQARRQSRANWADYMDAIHKPEEAGFMFEKNNIYPISQAEQSHLEINDRALSAPIAVTGESLGNLVVELEEQSPIVRTNELVNTVARQVAQQIENLRLLNSAERYRFEAEEAARRQARENWKEYKETNTDKSMSYMYDLKEVRSFNSENDQQSEESAATLPLKVRDETIGKLVVQGLGSDDAESLALASAVAERLSAHIESLRQFEETKRGQVELDKRASQLAAVANVSSVSSRELDIDKMLHSVVHLTQRQFGLYHAHIFIYNENTAELKIAACGYKEGDEHEGTDGTAIITISQEKSIVARSARTRQAVIVNDVRHESGWLPNPLLPDTASELAVPLIIGDQILGVLDVQSDIINAFSEEDANIYTTLASQVSTALQNARSFVKAQQQAERETTLNLISQKIQSATTVEAVLQIAARELGHALGAPMTIAQLSMKDKK